MWPRMGYINLSINPLEPIALGALEREQHMVSEASKDPELDPIARAVVEARAREAGISSSQYLTHLVLMSHYGGGASEPSLPESWSTATSAALSPFSGLWLSYSTKTRGNELDRGNLIPAIAS